MFYFVVLISRALFGRLLVLIFSLVVPAIFDPIAYWYLFSQQINIHTYMSCLQDLHFKI